MQNDLWHPWLPPSSIASYIAPRSPTSRPVTAPFNLRGRHARVTPSGEPSSSSASDEQAARTSLRQCVSDVSHAHTYSRDHRRILRARVNVQAEIQHQYNRLQVLRRERRRLEDRLRQLQNNHTAIWTTGEVMRPREEDREPQNDFHVLVNDYNDINELLTDRIRTRIRDTVSDPLQNPISTNTPYLHHSRSSLPSQTNTPVNPLGIILHQPIEPAMLLLGPFPHPTLSTSGVGAGEFTPRMFVFFVILFCMLTKSGE